MRSIFAGRPAFACLFLAATCAVAAADPSAPDAGFGNQGVVIEDFGGVETGGRVLQLSTGKLLLAGGGSPVIAGHSITRYNLNGTIDTSYGIGGTADGFAGPLWGLTVLPDDSLLAATSFGTGSLVDFNDAAVARYTATGARDTSFGNGGLATFRLDPINPVDEHATDVIQLKSGKLLVCGYLWRGGLNFDIAVLRLTSTGQIDTTFGDGGRFLFDFNGGVDKAWKVLELPDDSIIVYGEIEDRSVFPQPTKVFFMRLTSEGEIDTTFGGSGTGYVTIITDVNSDTPAGMKRLANGKFVFAIGGTALWTVARLNANGTLDGDFGTGGVSKLAAVFPIVAFPAAQAVGLDVQSDGRIVLGGWVSGFTPQFQVKYDLGLARFEPNGVPDTTFHSGSAQRIYTITEAAPESGGSVLVQKDGKIVIGGYYPNGVDDRFMLRVNGDEPSTTTSTTLPDELCGDANGDGKVNATDALSTLRAAVGFFDCPLSICDVNGDGEVRATDALRVLQYAVGAIPELICLA